uniref:DNA gyrase subunit A n=1 Tax=Mycoplasmopsis gallinacea TaxID=29556 RepID=A0A385GHV1_9BACT|nr:DNA topoisomerase II subunit A [Mycoplasmopsis gallinacea]AXX39119.1 DNA topoisomerase II subunit A [Mycoplasmopsis gallinacea]AXX39120.1 DNA topoisomerase II subunit A [Mycoplasmopsis gallinacea]AXX39121.1 DNA topoisomerase II subunit A [Mycoplasmopsis gallinacea]AXX39122.1 DNA topoisomerase II subunit A [Mycoplasmopsis gallinacea]
MIGDKKDNLNPLDDSDLDSLKIQDEEYEYEEDKRMVFGNKNKTKQLVEEEEEEIPQNKEEYRVSSQIIENPQDGIFPILIDKEMSESFLDYSMSVIVSRALPDARDGLKPVHRRILYDMSELGLNPGTPHRKSARIVGDVLGKYHPHGDSSVYEAMVRMAQDFSMRYPLVDGHGNFGSIDGDEAAAMRYTEARMSKVAAEMLESIKKETVDFVDNYDGSEQEPSILPSRFPNLLVSGSSGIAVGMATEIPPHNLGEAIDATIAFALNPEITTKELMQHLKGPDFPTGGIILGTKGIYDAYETGKGKIPVRSKTEIIEHTNGKSKIIVKEIPYAIRKTTIVQKIAELHKDKVIEGISDLRDESNRDGIRIVIDVKKGYNPHILLNKLFQKSYLQTNFNVNMVALVNKEPKLINLKTALSVYWDHQKDVVTRRLKFDLNKAEEKAHILDGLKIAVSNIDEVVQMIKTSKTDQEAQDKLANRFNLSERQTKAILDMNLRRLTGLNIEKMDQEILELKKEIEYLQSILASEEKLRDLIIDELNQIKAKFNDARRTVIDASAIGQISDEDLIAEKDIVITSSTNGYVKRINLEEYNTQRRGGVGTVSMKTYNDDDISNIIKTNTHTDLLLFSNKGKAYSIRAHQIPEASKQSKGIPFINIVESLDTNNGEKIVSMLDVPSYDENTYLATVTKKGIMKRTPLSEYQNIRRNGLNAFKLQEDDELVRAFILGDDDIVLIANNDKNIINFKGEEVRATGRNSVGTRGMKLDNGQQVISASSNRDGEFILSIGSKGFGKLTKSEEYRITHRGSKGVSGINAEKAGNLVFARFVELSDEVLIITTSGITIRINVKDITLTSRNTKGVKIISLKDNDEIVAAEVIKNSDEQ